MLPAVAAAALLGTVVAAGVAGGWSGEAAPPAGATTSTVVPAPTTTTAAPVVAAAPTTAAPATSTLTATLHLGSSGEDVRMVQQRLLDLGFERRPPADLEPQPGSSSTRRPVTRSSRCLRSLAA